MSILMVVEDGRKYVEQGTKTEKLWAHREHRAPPPSHSHPPKIVDLFLLVKHFSVAYYRYILTIAIGFYF